VTYGGSDGVVSWRYNVAETMEVTTSPMSNYAPSYATGYFKATGHITEMDPIPYNEPVPEDEEAFSDYGDQPIEVDLTIHVPSDVIVDDHALALVQVVPPDTDISDVPETWVIYDLDFAGDPSNDGEDLDGPYDGQYDYEEDSTLNSYAPGDDQEEIYYEPGEGSYCKGNPFRFRLPPAFRSRHLISLLQRLRSHDIVRHPLPTRFPSDPPSAHDTLTRHVCRTLHVFTNFGLLSYIHYFVY